MRCPSGLSTTMTALVMGSAFPTIAHAQSTGLEDMVGARAGQAEMELRRRGYASIPIGGTPIAASA